MAKHSTASQGDVSIGPPGTLQALHPTWRNVITLLLIFHLASLAIAVMSRTFPLSPLRNSLSDVPIIRSYLQLLNMDLAYNFHLTDGLPDDFDHRFVIEPVQASTRTDSAAPSTPRQVLPEEGLRPGIRRKRFQELARRTATEQVGNPGARATLAKAVASGLLRHVDAPVGDYRLRIERQLLVARENADSPDPLLSDPGRLETAYEGAVIVSESQVDFIEIAPEAQRAGLREESEARDDRSE